MNREQAFEILQTTTKSRNLINHGLAVEGAMRHFAKLFGFDEEYWGNIGLLHDVDYEMYPTEHLRHTAELLKPYGVSDAEINSINSHGWVDCCVRFGAARQKTCKRCRGKRFEKVEEKRLCKGRKQRSHLKGRRNVGYAFGNSCF